MELIILDIYNSEERKNLLKVARDSIKEGLFQNKPINLDISQYSEKLQQYRACFVTLQVGDALRGCIGSLQAHRPLVEDVAENAFSAAFQDSRFLRLAVNEYDQISVHISVLSQPEPISFSSEVELLKKIRPGIDGLILSDGVYRGTFLPSVWEKLPGPKTFLMHLKNKAGLSSEYWSNTIKFERYTAEMIE